MKHILLFLSLIFFKQTVTFAQTDSSFLYFPDTISITSFPVERIEIQNVPQSFEKGYLKYNLLLDSNLTVKKYHLIGVLVILKSNEKILLKNINNYKSGDSSVEGKHYIPWEYVPAFISKNKKYFNWIIENTELRYSLSLKSYPDEMSYTLHIPFYKKE
ncbi:hypothetical protein [Algivirga pacifica]|uniref:Uncharacterized protein n=1 Tax=Algivirga pacifica TaxID=1162670 RepID=A0ABP9D1A5_9BACT